MELAYALHLVLHWPNTANAAYGELQDAIALHRTVSCHPPHGQSDRRGEPVEYFAAGGQQGFAAGRAASRLYLVQPGTRTPATDAAGAADASPRRQDHA